MKKKNYNDDDGRRIADMSDVNATMFGYKTRRKNTGKKRPISEGSSTANIQPLTKEETRFMMLRAIGAGLLIALVFIVGAALFILFCIYIWFR